MGLRAKVVGRASGEAIRALSMLIAIARETVHYHTSPQAHSRSRHYFNQDHSTRTRSHQQQRFDPGTPPPHQVDSVLAQISIHRPLPSEHGDEHARPQSEHDWSGEHSPGLAWQQPGSRVAGFCSDCCGREGGGGWRSGFRDAGTSKRNGSRRSPGQADRKSRGDAQSPRPAEQCLSAIEGRVLAEPSLGFSPPTYHEHGKAARKRATTSSETNHWQSCAQPATGGSLVSSRASRECPAAGASSQGFREQKQGYDAGRRIARPGNRQQGFEAKHGLENEDEAGLDGVQDEGKDVRGRGGIGRVRGLVGRWEERTERAARGKADTKGWKSLSKKRDGGEVPIVFPLHVNKFVRRSSIGTPIRPETPLNRSDRGEETIMHAPRPQRSIPTIQSPAEDAMPGHIRQRNYGSPAIHLHGTRKRCVRHGRHDHVRQDAPGQRRVFGGTTDMLVKSRSGAYIPIGQVQRQQMEATSPWIAAIDPLQNTTGLLMGDVDACPDCLQEFNIKKREMYQEPDLESAKVVGQPALYQDSGRGMQTVRRPRAEPSHLYAPASHSHSTDLVLATDPDQLATPAVGYDRHRNFASAAMPSLSSRGYDPAWQATPYQTVRPALRPEECQRGVPIMACGYRSFAVGSETPSSNPAGTGDKHVQSRQKPSTLDTSDETGDLVVTKTLGDGLNAVVVEHEGHLRQVVLNKRDASSEADKLQRLSRELASVANAIAFAKATREKQASRSVPQYSVVLDKMPTSPETSTTAQRAVRSSSSIPELLNMIDQTAGEIYLESNTNANQYVSHRRQSLATTVGRQQSLMHSDEMHDALFDLPTPGQQMAHRQSIGEQLSAVRERMAAMKAAQVKGQSRSDPKQSVPTAGQPVPTVREEVPEETMPELAAVSRFTKPANPIDIASTAATEHASKPGGSMPPGMITSRSVQSDKDVPRIITTERAAFHRVPKMSTQFTAETPPPTAITQPAKPIDPLERVSASPVVANPTKDRPSSTLAVTPTPRAVDATSQHHSYFPNLLALNPFHRRTPQGSSSDHNDSVSEAPLNPLTAAAKTIAPLPITTQANPYHHAPAAPLGLYFAEHADPAVQERAQVIRAAMQMEKKKMLQGQAAALERETRRARRQSGVVATAAGKAASGVKKGWFG